MNRLTQKIWNANQSWYYEALWQVGKRKIRIDIRRNAYDEQSYGRAKIFEPDQACWNEIAAIPPPQLASLRISYVQRNITGEGHDAFTDDEKRLLDEVRLILGEPVWLWIAHLGTEEEVATTIKKLCPTTKHTFLTDDHPWLYENEFGEKPTGGTLVALEVPAQAPAYRVITPLEGRFSKVWKWGIFDYSPEEVTEDA